MKTRLIVIATLVLMLALPLALNAQETDPAAVVTAYYEAALAHDIEAYLALMTDDAVVEIPGFGAYTGLEEIRAWMEGLMALNSHSEYEIVQVEGDTVTLRTTYTDDEFRALGIVLEATETIVVQDGKVVSDTWVVTEESMAELQAAMAGLPVTGGASHVGYALLIALGSLAVVAGLGLKVSHMRSHPD